MTYVGIGPEKIVKICDTSAVGLSSGIYVYSGVSRIQVSGYSKDDTIPSAPGGGSQFDGTTIAAFCVDVADGVIPAMSMVFTLSR